ncbi:MAG: glycyl-radical enzyme activating protein [Oscillospiraceae bacterium]|jgi:pyruvate formate lyase activating enzyme|nr:glycyl-radical enzyme activating protein [Oscillospiraceae bacterium]
MTDHEKTGYIFNIQHFSLHDGPGIRTNVFLKGCPLRCRWCCNPESHALLPEAAFDKSKCILCGACSLGAKEPAVRFEHGEKVIDRTALHANGERLALVCPTGAISLYGEQKSVGEILDEAERDAAFYSRGGGGITLSGGEPLFQAEFATAILREAKRRHIRTAIETCGHVPWETLREAAEHLDYVLYDIKSLNSVSHKEQTGVGNEQILENFRLLCEHFPALPKLVRTPVIPEFNEHEALEIKAFAESFPNVTFQALSYHTFGVKKYAMLGKTYTGYIKNTN